MQNCVSDNAAFPPSIIVGLLHRVWSILLSQSQSPQVFANGLWQVLSWSSPSPSSPGSQFSTCFALLSLLILATCPNHISIFLLKMQPSPSCPVLSLIIVFGIFSFCETCRTLLSYLWCAAFSLLRESFYLLDLELIQNVMQAEMAAMILHVSKCGWSALQCPPIIKIFLFSVPVSSLSAPWPVGLLCHIYL